MTHNKNARVISSSMDPYGFEEIEYFLSDDDKRSQFLICYGFSSHAFFRFNHIHAYQLRDELLEIEAERRSRPRDKKFQYFKQWFTRDIRITLNKSSFSIELEWEGRTRDRFNFVKNVYDRKTRQYNEVNNIELVANDMRNTVWGTQIMCDLNFLASFSSRKWIKQWEDQKLAFEVYCDTALQCQIELIRSDLVRIFDSLSEDWIDTQITFMALQDKHVLQA